MGSELFYQDKKFDPLLLRRGSIFLADRLSGNTNYPIYRQYRAQIFSAYYTEMRHQTKDSALLLMVRKADQQKQITRYIKMGFELLGETVHKGREHSIVIHSAGCLS
jgi:hypothetical protein